MFAGPVERGSDGWIRSGSGGIHPSRCFLRDGLVVTSMDNSQSPIEVIVLGSGTSHGVPMIGCHCAVCTSDDPRDKRTRAGIFVRAGGARILVDTSPELRLQCVDNGIDMVDVILFTHHHADHVVGLDDLRRFNWLKGGHMICRGSAHTLERVRQMFPYAFTASNQTQTSKPALSMAPIDEESFSVGGAVVTPIPMMHGKLPVFGYRFGRFAYCTDCSFIPDGSIQRLADLDVLMLDATRRTPHATHFNLEQAVETAGRIGARKTYFTHVAHELKHAETNAELPDGMMLAHDGLRFEVRP